MSVGTGRHYYNSILEITVSFLGIRKWEPDIYIEFSPALNLQCNGHPWIIAKYLGLTEKYRFSY
jgi:hypothetical protein